MQIADRAEWQDRHCGGRVRRHRPRLWLVGELAGRQLAEAIQLTVEYDPQPPFAGHTGKASDAVRKQAKQLLDDRTDVKQTLVKPRIAWNRMIDFVRTRT